MPLKIRQKKRSNSRESQHPKYYYGGNTGQHWAEKYREENMGNYRKSFIAIICVMIIIVGILIANAISSVITATSESTTQISAADTFAISSYEQSEMADKAMQFAEGILVYAYCSDNKTAAQGKIAALQLIPENATTYAQVRELEQVDPSISPANIAPVTTDPQLQDPTRAYAGTFTYEFDGVVADTSVTSENNPDGTFIDGGYHFTITFSSVEDEATDEQVWAITNAIIRPN